MTKAVYMYDENNQFTNTKLVEDDYQISGSETFIAVPDGQYQPSKFTGTKWVGTDQAVWQSAQDAKQAELLKEHPELAPKPSSEQLMINALGQQVASLTVRLAQANATSTAPASDATITNNGGAA